MSNSTETELSRVKAQTYTRFLMSDGEIRILSKEKERDGAGREAEPTPVMGIEEPLPTTTEEEEKE
jgi:hypothetical protein